VVFYYLMLNFKDKLLISGRSYWFWFSFFEI